VTPGTLSELSPALARLACSGERHTIRWEGGDLAALDHEDPEGERALVALGGTSCTCIDVLGAWSRQKQNARLLSAFSRGTQDPVRTIGLNPGRFPYPGSMTPRNAVVPARGPTGNSMWVAVGPQGLPSNTSPMPEDDAALLAGLGHELTLRLVATLTAVALDRMDTPDGGAGRPALEASLFGRALSALRMWLAIPDLDLELVVAGPGQEPGCDWDGAGPVHLTLPLDWVVRVWGRDLTVVAGRFSLGIVDWTSQRTTLATVGSDLGSLRQLSIEIA
jgi:hypothetical protein